MSEIPLENAAARPVSVLCETFATIQPSFFRGNQVSITAEIKQEKEIKEGDRVLRAERYFGQVSRTFQLAQDIDDSAANASFADGVLELTLPKKAANSSKHLSID